MKFAVLLNDSKTAHLEEANSSGEAIEKAIQEYRKHGIDASKAVAYLVVE